nr:hypothetical protein [uncultured Bacillus sp.]
MQSHLKIVKTAKNIGGSILILGFLILLYGIFISGYNATTIGIGIGTIMGSVWIFIMGVFLAATDEMLENTDKGTPVRFTLYRIK